MAPEAPSSGWSDAGLSDVVDAVDRRQGLEGLAGDAEGTQVQLLTDPWSVWCWGFEPVRRTLQLRYPTIRFDVLVGGMFPEVPDHEREGFDLDRFFESVHATTGMPVPTTAMEEDPPDSTYPACIHVHAVRLVDPSKEAPYLRALREAVYLDGRNVNRRDVAAGIAERVGVPADRFEEMLDLGDAEREFEQRLEMLHQLDLVGYPTILVNHQGRSAVVRGFQPLPGVLAAAEAVARRDHPPDPAPDLEAILPAGERVATREVAQVLGVPIEQAHERLSAAAGEGRLARDRMDHADVWRRSGSI